MATLQSFQTMLNEYLTYDLLKEEMIKRDYVLTKVEKDNGWKGGTLVVPFMGAGASSIAFGELVASNNVSEDLPVRGQVTTQKELWGTMVFNHRDLIQHDGSIPEKTFLRILPDAVDRFMENMKQAVSVNLLNGAHFATLTSDGAANGTLVVDHPERFSLNQEIFVDDANSPISAAGYVASIDLNTKTLRIVDTRGGTVGVNDLDLSAFTVAQSAKVYHRGALTVSFQSIRDALLSAANGGSATLHGQTKTAYPILQAINVSGAGITAANLLDKVFDAYTTIRSLGKGNASEVLMSYKHLGTILKLLETSKGSYNVSVGSTKASVYGWTEITIGSVKGSLKVVGIQEMDDDVIMFVDWKGMKFHSNGFFRKRVAPDGKHYFEQRATTGYSYLVDMCLFGELVVSQPQRCGIIHSIPAY